MKNVILKLKNLVIEKNNKKKKTHKISEFKFKKKIKYSLYNIEILHYKERKKIHSITCEWDFFSDIQMWNPAEFGKEIPSS